MTENEKRLIENINSYGPVDAIVVEGYDGVGKGRVLKVLSDYYGITPYRPDYNLWQQFDHRNIDRWKVSGFFWDVFSHFNQSSGSCSMLFDRGVLSGAVYNKDIRVAKEYKKLLRDMKVLHILVECNESDYKSFNLLRNPELSPEELDNLYKDYLYYTSIYESMIGISGVPCIVYNNVYNNSLAKESACKCKGCGHYAYGWCRHPSINREVDENHKRCHLSEDKEVQDIGTEMFSLQS